MANQMMTSNNNQRGLSNRREQGNDYRGLITQFLNFLDFPAGREMNDMQPKIELSETANDIMITAEMPGVAEEDIDVVISADGYMTISGEKRDEHEESSEGSYFSEISYGHVSRTIPLPTDLQFDQADAEYVDGVLMVAIPKSAEAQEKRKKIAVSHGENGSRRNRRRRNKNRGQAQSQQ